MPIYEWLCPTHGRFETYYPYTSDLEEVQCSVKRCKRMAVRLWSRVTMQPDPMWAGHYDEQYGYVTSKSQLARIRKSKNILELGDHADVEGMKKVAEDARRSQDEKLSRETKEIFERTFGHSGLIDSDGQATPDAFQKLSDKPILSTNDERLA